MREVIDRLRHWLDVRFWHLADNPVTLAVVCYWHLADIEDLPVMSAFGGKADMVYCTAYVSL